MYVEDLEQAIECVDCRAYLTADGPSFDLGESYALCYACAARRGGRYDALGNRWSVAPDLTGALDEGGARF